MTLSVKKDAPARTDSLVASEASELDAAQQRVGYKNPPKHSQFKTSGNPGGRPKKPATLDFDKLVIQLLESRIAHSDKTWLDVLLGSLAKQSAQGDIRATKYLCELYLDAKRRKRHSSDDSDADRQAAERILASVGAFTSATFGSTKESETESSDAAAQDAVDV